MLSDYQVQIVKEHEELKVRVENLGTFFVLTPSASILNEEGDVDPALFIKMVKHTYTDFFDAVAMKYGPEPFQVVTYFKTDNTARLDSEEMAKMANELIQNLWKDGHMNGQSVVISMGSLKNRQTGESHHLLLGFTFRSSKHVVYLMEGENGVRGI